MATGTGNLPYPMPPVSPFDVITSQAENERIANIKSLADGTGIGDGAVTSDKIDFATLTPAVRAIAFGEDSITTGVYKTKSLALQANVVYVVHASIEWIGGGGGNKRIAFRVGETEVDSHRIEGSTQTNMTLIGLIRPLTSGPFQFDISISNIVGAATGTIGLTRYNAMPIMTTAPIA